MKTIFRADINKKLKIIAKFAIGTELRQGELLALDKPDVDIEKSEVAVTKTL